MVRLIYFTAPVLQPLSAGTKRSVTRTALSLASLSLYKEVQFDVRNY